MPRVQLSAVKRELGVNCILSHRSILKEQCWKGQLFEKHFTSAAAGWIPQRYSALSANVFLMVLLWLNYVIRSDTGWKHPHLMTCCVQQQKPSSLSHSQTPRRFCALYRVIPGFSPDRRRHGNTLPRQVARLLHLMIACFIFQVLRNNKSDGNVINILTLWEREGSVHVDKHSNQNNTCIEFVCVWLWLLTIITAITPDMCLSNYEQWLFIMKLLCSGLNFRIRLSTLSWWKDSLV